MKCPAQPAWDDRSVSSSCALLSQRREPGRGHRGHRGPPHPTPRACGSAAPGGHEPATAAGTPGARGAGGRHPGPAASPAASAKARVASVAGPGAGRPTQPGERPARSRPRQPLTCRAPKLAPWPPARCGAERRGPGRPRRTHRPRPPPPPPLRRPPTPGPAIPRARPAGPHPPRLLLVRSEPNAFPATNPRARWARPRPRAPPPRGRAPPASLRAGPLHPLVSGRPHLTLSVPARTRSSCLAPPRGQAPPLPCLAGFFLFCTEKQPGLRTATAVVRPGAGGHSEKGRPGPVCLFVCLTSAWRSVWPSKRPLVPVGSPAWLRTRARRPAGALVRLLSPDYTCKNECTQFIHSPSPSWNAVGLTLRCCIACYPQGVSDGED